MAQLDTKKLSLSPMASGHLCLNLTENISWDQFPKYAEELAANINACISNKSEGADMHIWTLQFHNCLINTRRRRG